MKSLEDRVHRTVAKKLGQRRKRIEEDMVRSLSGIDVVEESEELRVTGCHLLTRWLMAADLRDLGSPR